MIYNYEVLINDVNNILYPFYLNSSFTFRLKVKSNNVILRLNILLHSINVTTEHKDTYKLIKSERSIRYYLSFECYTNTLTIIFLCWPSAMPG